MANEISVNGRLSITPNGVGIAPSANGNTLLSLSSSNSYYGEYIQNISSGSWSALATGSALNTRYIYVQNNTYNSTGSLCYLSANNTGSVFSVLYPSDFILLPYSGSVQYYAQAQTSSVQLSICITQA